MQRLWRGGYGEGGVAGVVYGPWGGIEEAVARGAWRVVCVCGAWWRDWLKAGRMLAWRVA